MNTTIIKNFSTKKSFLALMSCCLLIASWTAAPVFANHNHHSQGHQNHHGLKHHKKHRHGKHHERPGTHYEYGRVLRAKPIYETRLTSVPRQSCWQEQVTHHSGDSSVTGTIVGGIIGAAVGHELGHKKRNKQIGAVAGAVLGSSIGYDLTKGKRHKPVHSTRERCETVYEEHAEQVLAGYRVKYRYRGQIYRMRTDRHPGDRIKLKVSVAPLYKSKLY